MTSFPRYYYFSQHSQPYLIIKDSRAYLATLREGRAGSTQQCDKTVTLCPANQAHFLRATISFNDCLGPTTTYILTLF